MDIVLHFSIVTFILLIFLNVMKAVIFFKIQVGILVTCEDLYTDKQWKVCHAFATFVARRTEAGKVRGKNHSGKKRQFLQPCVCVCYVYTGTAEAGDSSHTNGADGVQPGSRAEEDEAHPC